MAGLRGLYRATRELYLDCSRERRLAEEQLKGAWADARSEEACLARLERAQRRESTLRRASMTLVRHINAPEQNGGA